jgi:hypothetical protein
MAQWDRVAVPILVEPSDLGALKEVASSTQAERKQFYPSSKTGRGFRSPARDAELGELFEVQSFPSLFLFCKGHRGVRCLSSRRLRAEMTSTHIMASTKEDLSNGIPEPCE